MVSPAIAEKAEEIAIPKISLDEWVNNPPSGGLEWVSGNLIEKTGMTLQHGRVQKGCENMGQPYRGFWDWG